tara:strand:+ start:307 stop:426 length:120 start_codon:yes stop_codon:yes gene_type:complete
MEAIYVITHIVIYVLGVVTGLYIASQVEKDIKKRLNRRK